MKILFCMTVYTIFAERCKALAHLLKDNGHEVSVVAGGIDDEARKDPAFTTVICLWPLFDHVYIDEFKPDIIIMWNGKFANVHAAACVLKSKYFVVYMEMGWLPQKNFSYISTDLAQSTTIPDIPYVPGVAENYVEVLKDLRSSYIPPVHIPGLPKSFVYVPLQVEVDTQILYTSPVFKSMHSLLGFVRSIVPPDIPVVTTNHPCNKSDTKLPDFVLDFTGKGKSIDVAVKANLIIGINSTLLVECLMYYKPVIALGKSVAKDAFVTADTTEDLVALIEGERPPGFRDRCDYRLLTVMQNQFDHFNPPAWIVEQIENRDFTPRTLPQFPPKLRKALEIRKIQRFLKETSGL
jgi:hypothetical protein